MSIEERVTRATLSDQVESAIRRDIIDGLLPPGERLKPADLGQKYGVSATPLREALQRLAARKLIDWDPRLGAAVAPVSVEGVRDIYWLRGLLEPVALQRSLEHGDDAWENELTTAWNVLRSAQRPKGRNGETRAAAWSRAHGGFHEALMSAAQSPWLLRFIATLADHAERYAVLSARTSTRDTLEEHGELYRAAVARDVAGAVAALEHHLSATVAVVEQAFDGVPKDHR